MTPEWITSVLAGAGVIARVGKVRVEPIGTGQMGSCFRLYPDYGEGDGPRTLIVKLPSPDPKVRAGGKMGYRCEVAFYRNVAEKVSVRVPRCYFAAVNEDGDRFTLVLEDLAPARQGDQIAGCSVEEARAAARNVAGLHAPTWNDPTLRELDWAIPGVEEGADFVAALVGDATRQFLDRYDVGLGTAWVMEQFADRFVGWATGRPEPVSLLHSDYRLDNLLFAPPGSADPVAAVDWQVVTVGMPLRDVGFLVSTGLPTPDRRRAERGIVEDYRRRLVELGVAGYEPEQCWDDYRFGLFQAPFITVMGALVSQRSERGDRMFTTMAERSATAITDLDALSLL